MIQDLTMCPLARFKRVKGKQHISFWLRKHGTTVLLTNTFCYSYRDDTSSRSALSTSVPACEVLWQSFNGSDTSDTFRRCTYASVPKPSMEMICKSPPKYLHKQHLTADLAPHTHTNIAT